MPVLRETDNRKEEFATYNEIIQNNIHGVKYEESVSVNFGGKDTYFDESAWIERVNDDLWRESQRQRRLDENIRAHEEWLLNTEAGRKQKAKEDRAEKIRDAGIHERFLYDDESFDSAPNPSLAKSQNYFDNFPDVLPKAIRIWRRGLNRKAWRKFNKGEKEWRRNFDLFTDAYLYKLRLSDLDISKSAAKKIAKAKLKRPDLDLDDPLQIKLNAALLKLILLDNLKFGACWVKLEANLKSIHYHVIAERQALAPHLKRLEAKAQGPCVPVYDEVGLLGYLQKGTFTVKSYFEEKPEEGILKLAADIESKRRYMDFTGSAKGPRMLQFYPAKKRLQ